MITYLRDYPPPLKTFFESFNSYLCSNQPIGTAWDIKKKFKKKKLILVIFPTRWELYARARAQKA